MTQYKSEKNLSSHIKVSVQQYGGDGEDDKSGHERCSDREKHVPGYPK